MEPVIMVLKLVHWNKILICGLCFMVSRGVKAHTLKFQKQQFRPYKIQYYLPNNTILPMTIDKFDLIWY